MSATVATGYVRSKIHPNKLALWIGCGSIMMMFAAFTSAYIVRKAAGNWIEFPLPTVFYGSTVVIITSSVMLHLSYRAFKRGNALLYRGFLLATLLLGITFLILQYQGWVALDAILPLGNNPSGDFLYTLSGVHAAHILGGITILIIALLHACLLPYKVIPARQLRFELTLTYWHFVDLLWVYLFVFLLIQ
jgi:cytochrome c oxidase subunit 3